MKSLAFAFVSLLALALSGCASPEPHGYSPHTATADGTGMGGMMDEMCKRRAMEPGRAASAPDMMDKHCQARAQAPAGGASHAH